MKGAEALVRPAVDPSAADWIPQRLMPWWSLPSGDMPVGAIIPIGFDAYARILHPAYRSAEGREVPVRWGELAGLAGITAHAEMQWHEIVSRISHSEMESRLHSPPNEGCLPPGQAEVLIEVLRRHTTTPHRCWFAVWEGYGALEPNARWPEAARVHLPDRDYVLLYGPIEAAAQSFEPPPFRQSANLWWPENQAWCVATDIDYAWTYVAGTNSCIDDLLAESRLEALRIRPDQRAGGRRTNGAEAY